LIAIKSVEAMSNEQLNPAFQDFSTADLKSDHAKRPLWVCPNRIILLEAYSPIYQQAYDFLVAIAEPVSRPQFLHEYKLTTYSLFAAISTSLTTQSIIEVLGRLCKTKQLPDSVVAFITECTASYGKAKLVLKHNRFFVESPSSAVLRKLLQDTTVANARIDQLGNNRQPKHTSQSTSSSASGVQEVINIDEGDFIVTDAAEEDEANLLYQFLDVDDADDQPDDDTVLLEQTPNVQPLPPPEDLSDDEQGGGQPPKTNPATGPPAITPAAPSAAPAHDPFNWFGSDSPPSGSSADSTAATTDTATIDTATTDTATTDTATTDTATTDTATTDTATTDTATTDTATINTATTDTATTDTATTSVQDIAGQQPTQPKQKRKEKALAFEISKSSVEGVRKAALGMECPLMEEYDFRNDAVNANLPIDLRPITNIRPYQEKCLSKMFGNGRARSGLIVLPCGAGKTLVGVTAATTIKKCTLCLCTSAVSVQQWAEQFLLWSTVDKSVVSRFTSNIKDKIDDHTGIVVTTYTMVSYTGKRSPESEAVMEVLKSREWGLLLLDEVHVVPARMFRRVLSVCAAHCKLGLTATLVREDALISDLNFLIGPKLYEANWLDLTKQGFLASVQCAEVWCPMTPEFMREYLRADRAQSVPSSASSSASASATDGSSTPAPSKAARCYSYSAPTRQLLYVSNPNKFHACDNLIRKHEAKGDKIIIFSDNVFALKKYASLLGVPYIFGGTPESERARTLGSFRRSSFCNVVAISKVGDVALDLPEANVIIQVSSHYGARRQEAQRLGRILRPNLKRTAQQRTNEEFNAFFYTLVSTDTQEMYYSNKRRQYLIDQGYTFKIITGLSHETSTSDQSQPTKLVTKEDQLQLLEEVLSCDIEKETALEEAALSNADSLSENSDNRSAQPNSGSSATRVRRKSGSMSALSGASGGTRYLEYSAGDPQKRQRHSLFQKRFK
jgi:DNA excision repair protein ERCC-3